MFGNKLKEKSREAGGTAGVFSLVKTVKGWVGTEEENLVFLRFPEACGTRQNLWHVFFLTISDLISMS